MSTFRKIEVQAAIQSSLGFHPRTPHVTLEVEVEVWDAMSKDEQAQYAMDKLVIMGMLTIRWRDKPSKDPRSNTDLHSRIE